MILSLFVHSNFNENKNNEISLLLLTVLNIQTLDIIQPFHAVIRGIGVIDVTEKIFFLPL